jgi:hypothetical protein
MRGVEERSLSSILRSELLTTLINNDVSGKVNASGGVGLGSANRSIRQAATADKNSATQASSLVTKVD